MLGLAVVFLLSWILPGPAAAPTARFEVYCDGLGIYLSKLDGAPSLGKIVLFSSLDFPLGSAAGRYLKQGTWSDILVYGNGCIPDGKCEPIANGKVWIDDWNAPNTEDPYPKSISGKYDIDLASKHLQGSFVAGERTHPRARRFCM